jgi:hypothetical protein
MVAEARSGQDSAKQLEMEYTLRKQQRDLDSIADDLRGHRQSLIDLAGADAVDKLDKELFDERNKLEATNDQVPLASATGQTSIVETNNSNAQDKAMQNIDSAGNIASEKNKTQTASTLSPQS